MTNEELIEKYIRKIETMKLRIKELEAFLIKKNYEIRILKEYLARLEEEND